MAADQHIHIFTDEITLDDLHTFFSNVLGSRWFDPTRADNHDLWLVTYQKIATTPSIWIGEGSWLRASLAQSPDDYIPPVVARIKELIGENLPVITSEFIEQVTRAFLASNTTGYRTAVSIDVLDFLNQYKGKRCFTVSW